jgi:hypothetical protein
MMGIFPAVSSGLVRAIGRQVLDVPDQRTELGHCHK